MGVLGLWQLLAPVGQPVTLESLENKIFAVDISIWLNQALKGYRDSQGGSVANAHLLSLFSRLCKLLFYKIRPIMVFDGGFPELKKQTIINRQHRRAAVKQSSRDVGLKILTNYLASQKLGQTSNVPSSSNKPFKVREKPRDEIFKLPPIPESSQSYLSEVNESDEGVERKFTNFSSEDIRYLNQIDIESEDFDALPPDVKQEILSTLKESRKHRTWDQYVELPKESNDFSKYQMQCLLKRRKLQSKLEQVQKDIRKNNSSAYVSQYTNDHVIGETNKIMSDDTSYFVLLKKINEKKGSDPDKRNYEKPGTSVMADTKTAFIRDIENIDVEEDYSMLFNKTLKEESRDSISDAGKYENTLMNPSDEEYYVDNPPLSIEKGHSVTATTVKTDLNDVCKFQERPLQNDSLNLSDEEYDVDKCLTSAAKEDSVKGVNHKSDSNHVCGNKGNLVKTLNVSQESFIVSSEMSPSAAEIKIICEKSDISAEHVLNKSDAEIIILPEEQNVNVKNLVNETLVVSSEDEMIPCDEDETVIDLHVKINDKIGDELTEMGASTSSNKDFFPEKEINANAEQNLSFSEKQTEALSNENTLHSPSTSSKQLYSESSQILEEDLQEANAELQRELETATAILEAEQAKQDRQARSVQEHMVEECKELLQLFGIPYIVSPLEAEAQCAFYDSMDLTHGTITDDSDVWLFGGKRVFKNFFTQQKFVESYKDKEIFTHFGLSRKKLINFALLTGSDYTEGIEGVGPVTATEIISEFPGEGIDSLQKFKDWWQDSNKHAKSPENKVRAKLKKLVLNYNFPDEKVFDAYLNPEVDDSTEKFTWGRPDLDALREYARERFGWNQSKVDNTLLPVLKKLNERDRQTHIDSFFTATLRKETNLFPSKRIMSALKKITSPQKGEILKEAEAKATKRKAATLKKAVPKKVNRKVSSARGRKRNVKSQGPILSESSSDSDS